MNKAELITAVGEKAELSHTDATKAVEAVIDLIEAALVNGEAVKLSGFGIFEKKTRAARIGTNPSTGAKIEIAPANSVAFKPSKNLKEKLN
ncbi:MAG TPA: HU family DNA-binding protein [Candidatus Enteromonas pullicola]|uniref:HU family DNA-binding protein n=1 Tax=Candidatus Alloenteromonas pullicola TaxID=2840784 RepID=A0A9D1S1F0_9FIRM|nr:HU family DNA-binding protein [Candidatus Enteromonas pullicola]